MWNSLKKTVVQYSGELLFYFAWLIFLGDRYIKILYRQPVHHQGYLRRAIYVLLILKVAADLFRDRKIHWRDIAALGLVIFCYIISIRSGVFAWGLFIPGALLASARNIPIRRIYLFTMTVSLGFLLSTMIRIHMGSITDVVLAVPDGRVRHYFGFYSNYITSYIVEFANIYYYAVRRRPSWPEALVWLAMNGVAFYFTQSRAPFLTAALLCTCGTVFCRRKRPLAESRIACWILPYASLIASAVMLVCIRLYHSEHRVLATINRLMTERLRLGQEAWAVLEPKLFGQIIQWHTEEGLWGTPDYFYSDISYLKYLLMYGIVFMLLLHVGFVIAIRRMIKENDRSLLVGTLILIMIAMSDSMLTTMYVQCVILVTAMVFDPGTELSLLPVKLQRKER